MVDILDEDEDDDYVGDDNDDTDDALHVCYYITCMVYHFGVHWVWTRNLREHLP